MHPRLAHMLVAGKAAGHGGLACDIAALLEERDIHGGRGDCDLRSRLEILRGEGPAWGSGRVSAGPRRICAGA